MLNCKKITSANTKTLFVTIIILILLAAQLKVSAQGGQALDVSDGSIVISSTGYSQNGEAETAYTGSYIITGTTAANTVQVISGNHKITLDGCSIAIPATTATSTTSANTACAFAVIGSSDVTVTLLGSNALTSAAGYAGLYVSDTSILTIEGGGELTATGGAGRPVSSGTPYYGGGAGIGGNGYRDSGNFGAITIKSGGTTTTGGVTAQSVNYGAGAGIGSGGSTGVSPAYPSPQGTITIDGGSISATGGECINMSDTGGGSGLGSGGCNEEMNSYILVRINGGIVNARGNNDGAGIGGGANCHSSGAVVITGGTISAYGGDEKDGSTWGGAGIGGGDMGWTRSIAIGGDAIVTAYGGGAAAGIGGGNNGGVWDVDNDVVGEIIISDNAVVTSFGGSSGTTRGGAGIGAGRTGYPASFLCNSGIITIKDNAAVAAYAGASAQAAGVGTGYDYSSAPASEDVLRIDATVNLRLFNKDTAFPAYPPVVEGGGAARLVAFSLTESGLGAFPGIGERAAATRGSGYEWEYSGAPEDYTLALFEGGSQTNDYHSAHTAFGNWAVLASTLVSTVNYTIEYYYDNILDPSETIIDSADVGSVINAYPPKPRTGYTLSRTENIPLTVSGTPADNIIKVYYTSTSTGPTPTPSPTPAPSPSPIPTPEPTQIPEVTPPLVSPTIPPTELPEPEAPTTEPPKTGDISVAPYLFVMCVSILCVTVLLSATKRRYGV